MKHRSPRPKVASWLLELTPRTESGTPKNGFRSVVPDLGDHSGTTWSAILCRNTGEAQVRVEPQKGWPEKAALASARVGNLWPVRPVCPYPVLDAPASEEPILPTVHLTVNSQGSLLFRDETTETENRAARHEPTRSHAPAPDKGGQRGVPSPSQPCKPWTQHHPSGPGFKQQGQQHISTILAHSWGWFSEHEGMLSAPQLQSVSTICIE